MVENIKLWDRRFFNLSQIDITYYKIDSQGQSKSMLLHEGENVFEDEVITLNKMLRCYTVTSKKENYKYERGCITFLPKTILPVTILPVTFLPVTFLPL